MRIRRSPLFRLWVGLSVTLLMAGVVSPGLVWCQERDGRVNVEYGHCKAIHAPDSASQSASVANPVEVACAQPCYDTPLFTIGPNQDHSYDLAGLSVGMAGIALFCLPTDDSGILPITSISSTSGQINPSLISIQSTVLLI